MRNAAAPGTPSSRKPYAPRPFTTVPSGSMRERLRVVRSFPSGRTTRKVTVEMHDRILSSPTYEAPKLTVLGSVHGLTQIQDKKYGHSDGFTFMGNDIMNASP